MGEFISVWRLIMVCPSFIEDYVGFCRTSDVPYVPSIDEMERFCFTSQCCECSLYKDMEAMGGIKKTGYGRERLDALIFSGRYRHGLNSPVKPVLSRK
jgi:hypothetical protein